LANSLLITGASQLLTLRGRGPRRGHSLSNLGLVMDGALLVRDGLIAALGTRAELEKLPEARAAEGWRCRGLSIRTHT
jgi:imidazolonepropionase